MLKPITIITATFVALSTAAGCTTTNQSDESATQPNQTATQTGTTQTYPATPQSTTTPITQATTPTKGLPENKLSHNQ